jgi:hypothetical protein
MRRLVLEGQEETSGLFVRMSNMRTREGAISSVNLRDFESILIFFSEEEIEELQVAIDKRRSPALAEGNLPKLAEQSDHSANGVDAAFSEAHIQHPAQPRSYAGEVGRGVPERVAASLLHNP